MIKINYGKFYDPYPKDVSKIEKLIRKTDKVLDVGGWWKPLNRANTVVDILPCETCERGGSIGHSDRRFSKSSWIQLDICLEKWPFKNKEFDFVHCGQTLEDVRDPIFVCNEMMRVAKRGVITTPTIWIECQKGVDAYPEAAFYRGFDKHRWLIRHTKGSLAFIPKLNSLMAFDYVDQTTKKKFITYHRIWSSIFFWEGKFETSETVFQGFYELKSTLDNYFANFNYEKIMRS